MEGPKGHEWRFWKIATLKRPKQPSPLPLCLYLHSSAILSTSSLIAEPLSLCLILQTTSPTWTKNAFSNLSAEHRTRFDDLGKGRYWRSEGDQHRRLRKVSSPFADHDHSLSVSSASTPSIGCLTSSSSMVITKSTTLESTAVERAKNILDKFVNFHLFDFPARCADTFDSSSAGRLEESRYYCRHKALPFPRLSWKANRPHRGMYSGAYRDSAQGDQNGLHRHVVSS